MTLKEYTKKWAAFLCVLISCFVISGLAKAEASVVSAPLHRASSVTNGMVRVFLSSISSKTILHLTINGSYSINGNVNQSLANGEKITVSINPSTGSITLTHNSKSSNMDGRFQLRRHSTSQSGGVLVNESLNSTNPYPGDMLFIAQKVNGSYKLYTIVNVFIEDYLYGVVPYEMGNSAHIEALKAQAVAARTYTLSKMQQRSGMLYDVVDTTNDQVYRGTPTGNVNCKAAVDATRGIVSMFGSSLVETYYTASNGGQTESSSNAWGSSRGYLVVKDDPFDLGNTDALVKKVTVYSEFNHINQNSSLKALLLNKAKIQLSNQNVIISTIKAVTPHTTKYKSPSLLYTQITFTVTAQVDGITKNIDLTCSIFSELEKMLSMSINTTQNELWTVTKSGNQFLIASRRFGHGIGLSQRGAMQMGRLGYTYSDILGFYYQGSKRMQYTFSNTILSPLSPNGSSDITTNITPAELEEENSECMAIVSLVNKKDSLALRNQPSSTGLVLGAIPNNAPIHVYAIKDNWCFVCYNQTYGYVQKSGLIVTGTAPEETDLRPSVITEYAIVTAKGYLNLRSDASISANILGTAPKGSVLNVFSRTNEWAYIQYGSINAYASTSFMTFHSEYPLQVSNSFETTAIISLDNAMGTVNLRSEPSFDASILATIAHGTCITVFKNDGSWATVVYNGQTGYILSSFLSTTDESSPILSPSPMPTEGETDILDEDKMALYAIVTTNSGSLNLRSKATAGSTILTTIPRLTQVAVLERSEIWTKVSYIQYSGYVMSMYLTYENEQNSVAESTGSIETTAKPQQTLESPSQATENPVQTPAGDNVVITAKVNTASGSLNMRINPDSNSEVIKTIPKGTIVLVNQRGDKWSSVTYSGISGFVMNSFLLYPEQETMTPVGTLEPSPEETLETINAERIYARVTTVSGGLNLRVAMQSDSQVLTVVPRNTTIEVDAKHFEWSRITYRGYQGYVMNKFLSFLKEDDVVIPVSSLKAYVSTPSGTLNLRSDPFVSNNIILQIPPAAQVTIYERGVNWSYVEYNSVRGYVMSRYLSNELNNASDSGNTSFSVCVKTPNGGSLNLRETPNGKVVLTIPNTTLLTVVSQSGVWSKVTYNGVHGYVMSSYLIRSDTSLYSPKETSTPVITNAPTTPCVEISPPSETDTSISPLPTQTFIEEQTIIVTASPTIKPLPSSTDDLLMQMTMPAETTDAGEEGNSDE